MKLKKISTKCEQCRRKFSYKPTPRTRTVCDGCKAANKKLARKNWRKSNRGKVATRICATRYYKAHKRKIIKRMIGYHRHRYATDANYREKVKKRNRDAKRRRYAADVNYREKIKERSREWSRRQLL